MPTKAELAVQTLGERKHASPLNLSNVAGDEIADYTPDEARVALSVEMLEGQTLDSSRVFEKAGARERIFFDPSVTKAAIVTCGGLCPGLNNVIRSMVLELHHKYRLHEIIGYRYGYSGMNPKHGLEPIKLVPEVVSSIHKQGGSYLGVSRGVEPVATMVDTLQAHGINILFAVGGDGTLKGAHAIHDEIKRRGASIAVVGVPKTIDNDVEYVDKTFGFDTAVEMAKLATDGAHTEALSAVNGVGLVKVMGRDSGFIAAYAALASLEANYCLIPEVHFDLQGEHGLFASLTERLRQRGHAVIVAAEGCACELAKDGVVEHDASGNVRYTNSDADIGTYLKTAIVNYFKSVGVPITLKYIDPSYIIRSVPANANDSVFCDMLARQAVHAGMAGKTDMVVGRWHGVFTHVPIPLATAHRKRVDPDSALWLAVTETTGQPSLSNVPASTRAAAWKAKQPSL